MAERLQQKSSGSIHSRDFIIEATTRFELVIKVLQTHALPLGYVAIFNYMLFY